MEKLNIAQNESLCYFKQLFPMQKILDLKFKNWGLVLALSFTTSMVTHKLSYLLRSWFSHLYNRNTWTSQHDLVSPVVFLFQNLYLTCISVSPCPITRLQIL